MSGPSEGYRRSCGPAVLAAVAGIERDRAAELLHEVAKERGAQRIRTTTLTDTLIKALEALGRTGDAVVPTDKPTLAGWLRERRSGTWFVLAARHWLAVRDGHVIEDNGYQPMRGRVSWAFRLGALAGAAHAKMDENERFWYRRGQYDVKCGRPCPDTVPRAYGTRKGESP